MACFSAFFSRQRLGNIVAQAHGATYESTDLIKWFKLDSRPAGRNAASPAASRWLVHIILAFICLVTIPARNALADERVTRLSAHLPLNILELPSA
jgi:hypothetical protein